MSCFHNVTARTREERLAALNKDSVEKGNLKARTGGFQRYQEPGNPLVPEPTSPLYASESKRFQRDVAAEIKEEKLQQAKKHQETLERKRQEVMHREEQRWQQIEAERQAEEARMQHVRDLGLKGKTNHSSEHFNIISLDYHHTAAGDRLRFKDEVTHYRALLRSQNLFNKSHSVTHNIITGQPRPNMIQLPPAPTPPQHL